MTNFSFSRFNHFLEHGRILKFSFSRHLSSMRRGIFWEPKDSWGEAADITSGSDHVIGRSGTGFFRRVSDDVLNHQSDISERTVHCADSANYCMQHRFDMPRPSIRWSHEFLWHFLINCRRPIDFWCFCEPGDLIGERHRVQISILELRKRCLRIDRENKWAAVHVWLQTAWIF